MKHDSDWLSEQAYQAVQDGIGIDVAGAGGSNAVYQVRDLAERYTEHLLNKSHGDVATEIRELLAMADRAIMWEVEPSLGREFGDRVEAVLGAGGVEPHVLVKEG